MTTSEIKELQSLIKGYIDGEVIGQDIERLTEPGENFGSILLKVDLTVKQGDKENIYHTVAKCVPPSQSTQEIFNTKETFPAEIGWYSVLIPTLKEFQRQNGVENVIDCFCGYFGSRLGLDPNKEFDEHGLILLENLIVSGYKNEDRFKGLDEQTANAVLKSLAAFHAVPIAIKLKDPELFKEKINNYLEGFSHMKKAPPVNPFNDLFETPCDVIAENPEVTHLSKKVREECKIFPFGREGVEEPWATTIHTDFWTNNMMIKGENPPQVKIVDLQTSKYGSLTSDIVFFLMTSVQIELVREQFDEFLEIYYKEFIRILEELNVDTSLFPYDKYLENLDAEGKKLFPMCMFFVTVCNAKKGASDDVNNKDYNHLKNLKRIFSDLNEIQKEKLVFLVKFFAKKNWI